MAPAGYSGTPLAKKLGYKPGFFARTVNEPGHYRELLTDLPDKIHWNETGGPADLIHFFTRQAAELEEKLVILKDEIKKDGTIWVSWPKKTAGVSTDVNENLIRDTALSLGLVDVKVCAVDETWSGLKLVWRKTNRK